MKTKTLISIAIMLALPLTAMAGVWEDEEYNYTYTNVNSPAPVPNNGTVTMARPERPYQTLTIDNADRGHIASTAYVKGAYNDTIAAVNRVAHDVSNLWSDKQDAMLVEINDTREYVDSYVMNEDEFAGRFAEDAFNGVETRLATGAAVAGVIKTKQDKLTLSREDDNIHLRNVVASTLRDIPNNGNDKTLGTVAVMYEVADEEIDSKRVEAYTTWGNSNAKAEIAFVTASGN